MQQSQKNKNKAWALLLTAGGKDIINPETRRAQ